MLFFKVKDKKVKQIPSESGCQWEGRSREGIRRGHWSANIVEVFHV
jgi:hypothetical protein